ncbi:hypothetical protein [Burkholderia sp. USMB20]|uniref:hypothetical protein n=1 Tax=Burkholderia sp. USMB20 TaxID=1571773 RepID=UPI0009E384F8|nr:hypothetical protein [Burkholderia sp. USMB20]TGN94275.1 hypothetical protein PL79_025855 [Burkholderia sp. USMB20]
MSMKVETETGAADSHTQNDGANTRRPSARSRAAAGFGDGMSHNIVEASVQAVIGMAKRLLQQRRVQA